MKAFVLVYHRRQGALLAREEYDEDNEAAASRRRLSLEIEHRADPDVEVALIRAESRDALEYSHGNYFATADPTQPSTRLDEPTSDGPSTMQVAYERLEAIWPAARERLNHALTTDFGIGPDDADDLLQEVAIRAVAGPVEFVDVDDFCRWAYRVARYLAIDQARVRIAIAPIHELPGRLAGHGAEVETERHLDLKRTLRAVASLSLADREALLDPIRDPDAAPSRTDAVRLAVRRHRAQARLRQILDETA